MENYFFLLCRNWLFCCWYCYVIFINFVNLSLNHFTVRKLCFLLFFYCVLGITEYSHILSIGELTVSGPPWYTIQCTKKWYYSKSAMWQNVVHHEPQMADTNDCCGDAFGLIEVQPLSKWRARWSKRLKSVSPEWRFSECSAYGLINISLYSPS